MNTRAARGSSLGPIDIQLWRPANGGSPSFRCSRTFSPLRSGSRKTTIFGAPSPECRSVLGVGGARCGVRNVVLTGTPASRHGEDQLHISGINLLEIGRAHV